MIVAVLGAGGHGLDIAGIADAAGHVTYLLDDRYKPSHRCDTVADQPFVVGVNDPATRRRLAGLGDRPITLVHPDATIDHTARIEPGCVIGAGVHVGPNCYLGEHVHIGPGSTLTRTVVGSFTTISPGVDIAGDVRIGSGVLIGVGARVANLRSIGDNAVVGAGAVVVRDVAPGETVVSRHLTATGVQP